MPSWMITGAGKYQTTKWAGGSLACKTAFKSLVTLKDKDGKNQNPTTTKGQLSFNNVEVGDVLEYEVFTGADKTKAESDEFSVSITSLNWSYLIPTINQLYATASKQQLAYWEKNNNAFIDSLSKLVNPQRLFVTYSSQLHQTSSDGLYKGNFTIPSNIPSGPMTFNLLYGYNDEARSSDASRAWENAINVASWVAFAVEMIVSLAICPVTGGVGCGIASAIFTAQFAAEMANMTHEHLSKTTVGTNRYGCSFPNGGFIHNYSLLINNPNNDPFGQLENKEELKQDIQSSTFEITKEKLLLGLSLGGLFLLISSLSGGA
tara:strand:- start:16440 stop:17396 length:957 start_codon:yes stop_codon:yes gene_type:complete